MDFIYAAAPALTTFLFAYLSVNTDSEKRPVMRIMFLFMSLASLLVFMSITQTVAAYGEIVPDVQNTTYSWGLNNTLTASSTTTNYTHIAPITVQSYDYLWLIVSTTVWLTFIYMIILMLANGFQIVHKAVFKKDAEMDEIG